MHLEARWHAGQTGCPCCISGVNRVFQTGSETHGQIVEERRATPPKERRGAPPGQCTPHGTLMGMMGTGFPLKLMGPNWKSGRRLNKQESGFRNQSEIATAAKRKPRRKLKPKSGAKLRTAMTNNDSTDKNDKQMNQRSKLPHDHGERIVETPNEQRFTVCLGSPPQKGCSELPGIYCD